MNIEMILLILVICIMIGIVAVLLYKYSNTNKELKKLKNTDQKVKALNILQDFIEIIGERYSDSAEKINLINLKLIEKYEIKYSTIVLFDGINFKVEASNVSERHWQEFETLHNLDIFLESINNATPKYITVAQSEKLPYMRMELERAKSAIFYPIYVDNIYMGYWLIEGGKPHEFDNIDTTVLEVIKDNLISAINAINKQRTVENLYRIDDNTGVYTYEYLYGKARKIIDKYSTSIVSLVRIENLKLIANSINKKTSDMLEKKVIDYIKGCLSPEYILVKYSEDTYSIVFSGSDTEGVTKFLENINETVSSYKAKVTNSVKSEYNGQVIAPKLNITLMTYYKETPLEGVINSLAEALNSKNSDESNITCL